MLFIGNIGKFFTLKKIHIDKIYFYYIITNTFNYWCLCYVQITKYILLAEWQSLGQHRIISGKTQRGDTIWRHCDSRLPNNFGITPI